MDNKSNVIIGSNIRLLVSCYQFNFDLIFRAGAIYIFNTKGMVQHSFPSFKKCVPLLIHWCSIGNTWGSQKNLNKTRPLLCVSWFMMTAAALNNNGFINEELFTSNHYSTWVYCIPLYWNVQLPNVWYMYMHDSKDDGSNSKSQPAFQSGKL